jgi:hypothetical protein
LLLFLHHRGYGLPSCRTAYRAVDPVFAVVIISVVIVIVFLRVVVVVTDGDWGRGGGLARFHDWLTERDGVAFARCRANAR